jgi:hypothetical protein
VNVASGSILQYAENIFNTQVVNVTDSSVIQYVSNSGSSAITTNSAGAYPSLGSLLGFTNGQSGVSFMATNSYIINFDTYVSVWIGNLATSSLEPTQITFKIPVNVASGSILQYAENIFNTQVVNVTDSSVMVDRFIIRVNDRFGNIMNNNGIDWAFTLEMQSDT